MKVKEIMKKKSKIILLSLVILICGCYILMFCKTNSTYPQNEKIVYDYGESFVVQNAEITIDDAFILKKEEIKEDEELTKLLKESSGYLEEEDLSLALFKLNFKNTLKEDIVVDMTMFHLESGSFSLQFYYPLLFYYNNSGIYVELEAKEEKSIIAPVPIAAGNFLNYNAESILNRDYFLVCSLYPKKIMAKVDFRY